LNKTDESTHDFPVRVSCIVTTRVYFLSRYVSNLLSSNAFTLDMSLLELLKGLVNVNTELNY